MSSKSIYNIKKNYYTGNYKENIQLDTDDVTVYYKSLSIIDNYINNGPSTESIDLKTEYQQLIISDDSTLSVLLDKYISIIDSGSQEGIFDDIDIKDILSIEDPQIVNYALTLYFKILLRNGTSSLEDIFKSVSQLYKTLIKELLASNNDALYPYMELTFFLGQIAASLKNWDYLQGLIEFLNGKVDIASEDEIMLSFLELIYGVSSLDTQSKENGFYFVEDLVFNSSGNNLFVNLLMINLQLSNKNYEEAEQLINKIKSEEDLSQAGVFYEYFLIAQINYYLQVGTGDKDIIKSLREELNQVCELNGTTDKNPYLIEQKALSESFDTITSKYL
ncbi:uncharacterized protein HGUI_00814 [Hanseniaspora guilliermondii]|uniref:Coatomer subunit epsilon n=1 Tax=Hanseniaspora guilliermondii TaxID=56406 RepID=A0A1L0FG94_9ASCO|nr:uncharacterized protein HGUI_00814 [Hanseniaspora guilliermondii]